MIIKKKLENTIILIGNKIKKKLDLLFNREQYELFSPFLNEKMSELYEEIDIFLKSSAKELEGNIFKLEEEKKDLNSQIVELKEQLKAKDIDIELFKKQIVPKKIIINNTDVENKSKI
jgi:hypothetical protein